jgi:sugar lactone lactonase YvrE
MKHSTFLISLIAVSLSSAVMAQQQTADPLRTPGVQAANDPNRAAFVTANCIDPFIPEARTVGGAGARPPETPVSYEIHGIEGVVADGVRWRSLWIETGNNADSPIGVSDGVIVAQNDKSQILKVRVDGKVELLATDTYTGGALAMNPDGELFVGERALNRGIWRVAPRELFANTMNDEPLECLTTGVLNDMVPDSKGGFYMTMGGQYYISPEGEVSGPYGVNQGNGLALSADGTTLYVTGRLPGMEAPANLRIPRGAPEPTRGVIAYDVQADGSLSNERQFAWAGGDGMDIDAQGRLFVTGDGGCWVISPEGELIGFIQSPRRLISVAFGGHDNKTLFGIAIRDVEIFMMDMLTPGMQRVWD